MGSNPIVAGRESHGPGDALVLAQNAGGGPPAVDAELAAGAFDQGVGARLGDPHERADFLGKPVFADEAKGFPFAFGQQFEAGGDVGRVGHEGERKETTRSKREVRCGR